VSAARALRAGRASVFRHQDGVPALAHTGRDRPTHQAFAALDAFELIVLELDRIVTADRQQVAPTGIALRNWPAIGEKTEPEIAWSNPWAAPANSFADILQTQAILQDLRKFK
jgi:hypothetical protein